MLGGWHKLYSTTNILARVSTWNLFLFLVHCWPIDEKTRSTLALSPGIYKWQILTHVCVQPTVKSCRIEHSNPFVTVHWIGCMMIRTMLVLVSCSMDRLTHLSRFVDGCSGFLVVSNIRINYFIYYLTFYITLGNLCNSLQHNIRLGIN